MCRTNNIKSKKPKEAEYTLKNRITWELGNKPCPKRKLCAKDEASKEED